MIFATKNTGAKEETILNGYTRIFNQGISNGDGFPTVRAR